MFESWSAIAAKNVSTTKKKKKKKRRVQLMQVSGANTSAKMQEKGLTSGQKRTKALLDSLEKRAAQLDREYTQVYDLKTGQKKKKKKRGRKKGKEYEDLATLRRRLRKK